MSQEELEDMAREKDVMAALLSSMQQQPQTCIRATPEWISLYLSPKGDWLHSSKKVLKNAHG